MLDRYPVIPIFIGALVPPYLPFRRSRLLGESIGRFIASSGLRTLVIGSGGMSHHPTRYYPLGGEGSEEVAAYQLSGDKGGSFTDNEWFARLLSMHQERAEMLVSGQRTRADIRLNPEIDQAFMSIIRSGRLEELDTWKPKQLVDTAGRLPRTSRMDSSLRRPHRGWRRPA